MRIFSKTLKDELPVTLIFCFFLTVTIYLVIQEFAVARYLDFSGIIEKVPEPLKKIAETFLVLNVFGGYLHIVASVDWIILGSLYVSIIFSGLIARETEGKTLALLLSHPVGRLQALLEKYAAGVVLLALIVLFSFLGFYLGTYHGVINVPYKAYRFVFISINGFMYFLGLSSVALFFSVIFSQHQKAAVGSLLFFILSYLSFYLGAFSPRWATIRDFTLFRYFDTEKLFMSTQFQWGNFVSLLVIALIFLGISGYIFQKRDLAG